LPQRLIVLDGILGLAIS